VTLGICYERVPRFGGGVYRPILRRLETFTDEPLRTAIKEHEKRAALVLDLEAKIAAAAELELWCEGLGVCEMSSCVKTVRARAVTQISWRVDRM
jgi:hypothetical protein